MVKVSPMRRIVGPFIAAASLAVAGQGRAVTIPTLPAISTFEMQRATARAVLYALKVRLPEGQGLARSMIQIGVRQADAAMAAKLAAGHLGAGAGGCEAKMEFSVPVEGGAYDLNRVTLLTASSQTVIERRDGALVIAAQYATRASPRVD